jgi:CubicO group peptidase (beta-lactamase class C family)
VDDAIRALSAKWGVPGMAVGILRNGQMSLYGGGTLNLRTGAPVAPNSIFQIGSITKVFTATLIMRLVEQGKLSLDDTLAKHLPDLKLADPELLNTVTVRHLLNHMSGILGDHFPDHGRGDDALAASLDGISELEPVSPPDFALSYCNLGFMIAGRIVEVLTEKTFEQAMADEVFTPLKLDPITFFPDEAILYGASVGHITDENGSQVASPYAISRCSNAAGGIVTSTENLLRFAQFHLGDGTVDGERVLKKETMDHMREVNANVHEGFDWGVGWMLGEVDGAKTFGHGGSTNGQQAQLTIVPEHNYAIAVLTNSSRGGAAHREVITWALEHDLGLTTTEPEPVEKDDAWIERRLGTYRAPLTQSTIKREDDKLVIELVSYNPFSGEPTPAKSFAVAPIENGMLVTDGALKGQIIDFIDGDGPDAPPTYARVGLRLARRQ